MILTQIAFVSFRFVSFRVAKQCGKLQCRAMRGALAIDPDAQFPQGTVSDVERRVLLTVPLRFAPHCFIMMRGRCVPHPFA